LADKGEHGGKAVEHGRIVLGIERQGSQPHSKQWSDAIRLAALAVMLFGSLEEASVVDAAVLLQLVGFFGDVVEAGHCIIEYLVALVFGHLFWLDWTLFLGFDTEGEKRVLDILGLVPQPLDGGTLEVVHLLELDIDKFFNKGTLVGLGPFVVIVVVNGFALDRAGFAKEALQSLVVNVLVLPWWIDCILERLSEPHLSIGVG